MTEAEREARELLDNLMVGFGKDDYQENFPIFQEGVRVLTNTILRAERRGLLRGAKIAENWTGMHSMGNDIADAIRKEAERT